MTRTRTRLLREGAAALTDEELLAVVLGPGAEACARDLLTDMGPLRRLATRNSVRLRRVSVMLSR